MKVTPWEVSGEIDYGKLMHEFGTRPITRELLAMLGELPVFLRRGFFFSHRDFDKALSEQQQGEKFFVYTGRGPSGKMHIGHLPPFMLAKWLQDRFGVNVYIMLSDDEKFVIKRERKWNEVENYSENNILDIIAVGFDPDKTFIFKNSEYIKNFYRAALAVARKITFSTAKAVFGFKGESNIGIIFYPAVQMVPTFFERGRAVVPCGIDQDPYFRLQRDIAESFGYKKTALIHSRFLPPLQGLHGKMSASKPESAIWLDDGPEEVRRKIFKYAFSGGQPTVELHRKLGGNPDVDVSFLWLYYLFEESDTKIEEIKENYKSGKLLTGELKNLLIDKVNTFLEEHRRKRKWAEQVKDKFLYDGKLAKKMWDTDFTLA